MQLTPLSDAITGTDYIVKNGTGPGNGNDPDSQLYRLNTYFLSTDIITDGILTASNHLKPSQTNDWSAGGLLGWDYAVIHYGGTLGGQGTGGVVGAWHLGGMDSFIFPASAGGGFSSIDLFKGSSSNVPESSSTVALLSLSLLGCHYLRRKIKN